MPLILAEGVFRIMHKPQRFPSGHTRVIDFFFLRPRIALGPQDFQNWQILIVDSLTLVGCQGERHYFRVGNIFQYPWYPRKACFSEVTCQCATSLPCSLTTSTHGFSLSGLDSHTCPNVCIK